MTRVPTIVLVVATLAIVLLTAWLEYRQWLFFARLQGATQCTAGSAHG